MNTIHHNIYHQQGFLLPFALVIIIGVGALGVAVSNTTARSGISFTQEGLSLQAFYAAESGAQQALHQILFSVSDRVTADANCATVSGSAINFSSANISHCTASLTCSVSNDPANTQSFYRITSAGSCGTGDIFGQRTVRVVAKL